MEGNDIETTLIITRLPTENLEEEEGDDYQEDNENEEFDDSYFYDWSDDEDEPSYRKYIEDPEPTTLYFVNRFILNEIEKSYKIFQKEFASLKQLEQLEPRKQINIIKVQPKEQTPLHIGGGANFTQQKDGYTFDPRASNFKFKVNKVLSKQAQDRRHVAEQKKSEFSKLTEQQKADLEKKKIQQKIIQLEETKLFAMREKEYYQSFIKRFETDFIKYHMYYTPHTYNDYMIAKYKVHEINTNIEKLNATINSL
jgi:hypothetical protein